MADSRELSATRDLYIEGLRAISCIMVLLGHCLIGFIPAYVYNMFPIKLLWYASFAIDYFFIINGYGICNKYIHKGHVNCFKEISLRYIKMLIPVYLSCIISWLFMKLGWMQNDEAYLITGNTWLSWYYNWTPNFLDASLSGFLGVFFGVNTSYNGVLWTIHIEFTGVFLLLLLMNLMDRKNINRKTEYIIMLCFTVVFTALHSYIALFLYGAAVRLTMRNLTDNSNCPANIRIQKIIKRKLKGHIFHGIVFCTLILTNFAVLLFPGSRQGTTLMTASYPFICCAIIIFTCICVSSPLKRWLSIKPLQIIAKYSSAIYYLQLPLICSVLSKIYIELAFVGRFMAYSMALMIALIILRVLSYVYNNTIIKLSVKLTDRAAHIKLLKGDRN